MVYVILGFLTVLFMLLAANFYLTQSRKVRKEKKCLLSINNLSVFAPLREAFLVLVCQD
jgi:nucleoside 2-deoxyribosyltransferase